MKKGLIIYGYWKDSGLPLTIFAEDAVDCQWWFDAQSIANLYIGGSIPRETLSDRARSFLDFNMRSVIKVITHAVEGYYPN